MDDTSANEKRKEAEEEERKRRKSQLSEDPDFRVLTPQLNLQDIHAFTESGLKDDLFRK